MWVIPRICQFCAPKCEGVAHRALPDELLVQLADLGHRVLQAKVEVAAIRNRAARLIDEACRARPRTDRVLHPIDGHSRTELPDAAVGVAAGQHFENQVELASLQIPIGVGGSQEREELFHVPGLGHHHGEHHLGEHVEGAGDGPALLDLLFQDRSAPSPRHPGDPGRRGRRAGPGWALRPGAQLDPTAAPPRRRSPASAPAAPRPGPRCRCRARGSWWRPGLASRPSFKRSSTTARISREREP